jgi:hypothetical protein
MDDFLIARSEGDPPRPLSPVEIDLQRVLARQALLEERVDTAMKVIALMRERIDAYLPAQHYVPKRDTKEWLRAIELALQGKTS